MALSPARRARPAPRAPRAWLGWGAITIALAGCGDGGSGAASASAAARAVEPVSARPARTSRDSAPAASSAPTAKKRGSSRGLAPDQVVSLVEHVVAARKRIAAGDGRGALATLGPARALAPGDPRVLYEVAAAAALARDDKRADEAERAALRATSDAKLRAEILLLRGRRAESQRRRADALRAYADALLERDDATARAALVALGGKPEEIAPNPVACGEGFVDQAALCRCLVGKPVPGAKASPSCEPEPSNESLGDDRLSLLRTASEGEAQTWLVARDDDKRLRAITQLGDDYEAETLGATASSSLDKVAVRSIGERTLIVIKEERSKKDVNLGGLEQCEKHVELETFCVLGDKRSRSVCPISLPVDTTAGCSVGPAPAGLSEEALAWLDSLRRSASKSSAKISYGIDGEGRLSAWLAAGSPELLPPFALAPHELVAKPH